jgi:hypothetical protein
LSPVKRILYRFGHTIAGEIGTSHSRVRKQISITCTKTAAYSQGVLIDVVLLQRGDNVSNDPVHFHECIAERAAFCGVLELAPSV